MGCFYGAVFGACLCGLQGASAGLCPRATWNFIGVWEKEWGQIGGTGAPQPCLISSSLHSAPTLPPAHTRDELKRHYNLGEYWVEVEMEDLASFDEDLADYLYKQPAEHLQLVSGTPSLSPPGLVLLWSPTAVTSLFSSSRKLPRRWLMR